MSKEIYRYQKTGEEESRRAGTSIPEASIFSGRLMGYNLYITFQEEPCQPARIARNFGFDLEKLAAEQKAALLYTFLSPRS